MSDYNKANLSMKAGVDNVQEQISGRYYGCFHSHNIFCCGSNGRSQTGRPAPGQVLVPPQVRETAELQKISKRFDIDASVLQTEFDRGWGFKELRHAALLSLASGKNINEILRLKENNSWPRVEYLTGITPNDIKAARDRNDARYFAAALDLKERDILPYLRQNYALNDVLHAALLAQASGSTAESILAAHRPPTHDWSYVAYELDVSREKLDAIMEKIASVK